MNRNMMFFFVLLAILNFLIVYVANFFLFSIVGFLTMSLNMVILNLFLGIFLLSLSIIIILFLFKIQIPPYNKERQWKEERIVMRAFVTSSYMVLLFAITVMIYLILKIGFYAIPENREVLGEYFLVAFSAAIGALWGIGINEAIHFDNFSRYGRDYLSNIDWTRELETEKDWYPEIESFEKNLLFWKDKIIKYSVGLSLIFFVVLKAFNELFDKLSAI